MQRLVELAQQRALLARQVHRRLHHYAAEQVAAIAIAHRLHALLAQAEHATGLGLRRDLEHHLPIERWHFDTASEAGGGEADRYIAAQVHTVALEDRVLAHMHFYIQIAGRAAIAASL